MGFSSNGMQSIRYNHGMLRSRGSKLLRYRKYINVAVDNVKVDESRMKRLEQSGKQSAVIKLIIAMIVTGIVLLLISLVG